MHADHHREPDGQVDLLELIAAAFPGSRLRVEHGAIAGPLHHEGQFHSLRLRFDPLLEIFLDLPPLEGFELLIQWGNRWRDTKLGDPQIDDAYFIRTNDPLLARVWLDEPSRRALLRERVRIDLHDANERARVNQLRMIDPADLSEARLRWPATIEIRDNRLSSARGLKYVPPDELIDTLRVACEIAGASGRWAARCSELALLTGARVKQITDRIELGATAILLEQQRVDIDVRFLRRDDGSHARLTTRVRGNRASASDVVWSVVDGDVPRGPVPPSPAGDKVRAPRPLRDLDVRCSHEDAPVPFALLEPLFVRDTDKARAVIVTESDVTVWFDGAVLAAEPIAIAARIVAQLATDAVLPAGPYR